MVSTFGVAAVPFTGVEAVEDSNGMRVSVGVNVKVGSGVDVAVGLGGRGLGTTGVTNGTSGVGVAYVPQREGNCSHDVRSSTAMQNAKAKRLTSHPFQKLYPGAELRRCRGDGH